MEEKFPGIDCYIQQRYSAMLNSLLNYDGNRRKQEITIVNNMVTITYYYFQDKEKC